MGWIPYARGMKPSVTLPRMDSFGKNPEPGDLPCAQSTILLVEDEDMDADLTCRILRKGGIHAHIEIVPNGVQALTYLKAKERSEDRTDNPLPDLILCDITMPVFDGFDVLQWVRGSEEFKNIPFILLSGMESPEVWKRSVTLKANGLFPKSALLEPDKLPQAVKAFLQPSAQAAQIFPTIVPPPGDHPPSNDLSTST